MRNLPWEFPSSNPGLTLELKQLICRDIYFPLWLIVRMINLNSLFELNYYVMFTNLTFLAFGETEETFLLTQWIYSHLLVGLLTIDKATSFSTSLQDTEAYIITWVCVCACAFLREHVHTHTQIQPLSTVRPRTGTDCSHIYPHIPQWLI